MTEIKKMAVSVYFSKRHCFQEKPVPRGQGFTKIQEYLRHSKLRHTMKELLHELSTTNTIIGTKIHTHAGIELTHTLGEDGPLTRRANVVLKKETDASVEGEATRRNKLLVFASDDTLNHIFLDGRLNHLPKTGRQETISAKKRMRVTRDLPWIYRMAQEQIVKQQRQSMRRSQACTVYYVLLS